MKLSARTWGPKVQTNFELVWKSKWIYFWLYPVLKVIVFACLRNNCQTQCISYLYCCIIHYHKLSCLKQRECILSWSFCWSGVLAWLNWGLCSKSLKAEVKVLVGPHSHLERRVLFQARSECWQNSVPCGYSTKDLDLLKSFGQLLSSQHDGLLLLGQQVNLSYMLCLFDLFYWPFKWMRYSHPG